MVEQVEKPKEN